MLLKLRSFFHSLTAPEIFVILVLLILGTIGSLIIPISAGYDEETHLIRAWEMAHLAFVPNDQLAKLPFPAIYWDLSYRRQPIVEAVPFGSYDKEAGLKLDAYDYVYTNVETRSVYFPALLLPQALVLRYMGLSLQLPALTVYYACRLIGLLSYLLLCWLAVRLIPFGKWPLALLVTAPMALFQASTISADTISNGIGFLFLGASLAMASREEIHWKEWGWLVALFALLFMAKVNLVFLAFLPFLLLTPSRFKMKYGYALLAAAALVLLIVEIGGWNLVAYARYTKALEGADPKGQLFFILSSPLKFAGVIFQDMRLNTLSYLQGWLGVYGYDYWPVPTLTYWLIPIALIASLWLPAQQPAPDRKTRIVLVLLFILGYLLTLVSLYLAINPVSSASIAGVQGRYFVPVLPLLILALVSLPLPAAWRIPIFIPAAAALAGLALFMGGMLLSYRVACGSQYYRLDLCYQPQYKNWAPETNSSPAISLGMSLSQEIIPECDGMTVMRVWINSNGTDPAGQTSLTLTDEGQNKVLVQQTYSNSSLPNDSWLSLNFPVDWQSQNKLYLLSLRGSSPGGVQVAYSTRPEYSSGKLYENGTPNKQDMIFQYGCVAGLQRLLQGSR